MEKSNLTNFIAGIFLQTTNKKTGDMVLKCVNYEYAIYHHDLVTKHTWGALVTVNMNKGRTHSQFSKHLQTIEPYLIAKI